MQAPFWLAGTKNSSLRCISEGTRDKAFIRSRGATLIDTEASICPEPTPRCAVCCDHSWLLLARKPIAQPYLRGGAFFGQPLTSAFEGWHIFPGLSPTPGRC